MLYHRPLTILIGLISQSIIVNALTISNFTDLGEGRCIAENGDFHASVSYFEKDDCFAMDACGKTDSDWEYLLRGLTAIFNPRTNKYDCDCLFERDTLVSGSKIYELGSGDGTVYSQHLGSGEIVGTSKYTSNWSCYRNDHSPSGSTQGDPTIIGLQGQIFKFDGKDGGWYSNIASESLKWNMEFRRFDTCAADEDTFVSGISFALLDTTKSEWSKIIIKTISSEGVNQKECEKSGAACLGEGSIEISFDGGETFHSNAGDYHFAFGSRVIAHNTYGACSRKWHDYEVGNASNHDVGQAGNLRNGGSRRLSIINKEKSPYQYLLDKKGYMINPVECDEWLQDRRVKNDIFEQRGKWSTFHIETPLISFHVEYRRSNPDKFDRKCDFQSLDTWMTRVSPQLNEQEWNGILGETQKPLFDSATGAMITSDRSKLLRGKDDSDYEVDGPFGTDFNAISPPTTAKKYLLQDINTEVD